MDLGNAAKLKSWSLTSTQSVETLKSDMSQSFLRFTVAFLVGSVSIQSLAQAPQRRGVAPPGGTTNAGSSTREFIMSCTYGVLAGTLVGAATLAFTDQPGDNLNKVARGASLGLYAGILLGLYVVYVIPGQEEEEYEINPYNQPGLPPLEEGLYKKPSPQWKVGLSPYVSQQGVDGAAASFEFRWF